MRSRDRETRRPSSSAETSIDEDTADQLLSDDFSVPSSPVASRAGTMNYARPTSSAFEPQRRTPSFASSSQRLSVAPVPPPRHYQPSINTNTERDSIPPSIVVVGDTVPGDIRNNDSNADSILGTDINPFNDPPELAAFVPIAEKEVSPWPRESAVESTPKRKWTGKRLCLCVFVPLILLILVIVLVPVGLLVIKPKNNGQTQSSATNPSNTGGLTTPDNRDPSSLGIPQSALGTVLDSTKWLDWTDFNITYTDATVGGLSLMVCLS
jgi:hypothetical protein